VSLVACSVFSCKNQTSVRDSEKTAPQTEATGSDSKDSAKSKPSLLGLWESPCLENSRGSDNLWDYTKKFFEFKSGERVRQYSESFSDEDCTKQSSRNTSGEIVGNFRLGDSIIGIDNVSEVRVQADVLDLVFQSASGMSDYTSVIFDKDKIYFAVGNGQKDGRSQERRKINFHLAPGSHTEFSLVK
jgi:hypothetical protein